MHQEDVSFTFLHRIDEVELNVRDQRWQSALALALTLPDICGGIAFPELVKKYRDGRVMRDRQKNPSRDVGAQYIRWFDVYAAKFFKISPRDEKPYICGERCWQLRCEYLHQNKGFLNEEKEDALRFQLGVNCGTSVCQFQQSRKQEEQTEIRIDIEKFCLRMCQAARNYYHEAYKEKDFSLYNTPVLDFIQLKKSQKREELVVILCEDEVYAKGLLMALQEIPVHLSAFASLAEVKKKIGGRKPSIWISVEIRLPEKIKEPVIYLTHKKQESRDENCFTMPILPAALRDGVRRYLV